MSTKTRKGDADDFLSKMNLLDDQGPALKQAVRPAAEPEVTKARAGDTKPAVKQPAARVVRTTKQAVTAPKSGQVNSNAPANRSGLKHLGAYLMPEDLEKVALLRARLSMTNSELIEFAIQELFRAEAAKRKFGG